MSAQQIPPVLEDEAEVPSYRLPDPLLDDSGAPVEAGRWPQRRAELLRSFRSEIYGSPPELDTRITVELIEEGEACGGLGIRRQLRVVTGGVGIDCCLWIPKGGAVLPAFCGLNFHGNHTAHPDPAIQLPSSWVRAHRAGGDEHRANAAMRGSAAAAWPVELLLSRGYALATAYCGDIDPDYHDGFGNGIHAACTAERDEHSGGSISAWAWGLSRIYDALAQQAELDARRIAVIGHSRLGKTALWAAAQDERFAMAVSNDSGCLGAALSRRRFGERLQQINEGFPHWFCDRCKDYIEREAELPVDQHELLALIAPRPVYVASAAEDLWADPRGEFLSCLHAGPVYELLGRRGLGVDEPPALNVSVGEHIGYHCKPGPHAITPVDWWHYLAFADRHLAAP